MKDQTKVSRPRFHLTVNIELSDVHAISEVVEFYVDLVGIIRTPLLHFIREIMKNIAHRVFLGLPHIGCRLSLTYVVDEYTEIKKDGRVFKAHPCYLNK